MTHETKGRVLAVCFVICALGLLLHWPDVWSYPVDVLILSTIFVPTKEVRE